MVADEARPPTGSVVDGMPAARQQSRVTLADFVGTRDNNFNLVRFLAASAVLLSHSFALSTGDASKEPLRAWLGYSPGDIAVDVFFLTSGFLVTASLLSRRSVPAFVLARALRIYPGMIVSVVLTVLVAGLFFSSVPLPSFFSSAETWRYVAKNMSLITGIAYTLPGTFAHTPFPGPVNGSLWSLPEEIGMYAMLAVTWFGLGMVKRASPRRVGVVLSIVCVAAVSAQLLHLHVPRVSSQTPHLAAMFTAGGCMYIFRQAVPMNRSLFAGLAALLALCTLSKQTFAVGYLFCLPYLVLYLAHVPAGTVRRFNRFGDYSYGIYIYAFPIQQMLAASIHGIDAATMLVASFAFTLMLAIASWHWIEKPSLSMKKGSRGHGARRAQP